MYYFSSGRPSVELRRHIIMRASILLAVNFESGELFLGDKTNLPGRQRKAQIMARSDFLAP